VKEFDRKSGFGYIWIMNIDSIWEGGMQTGANISMEGFRNLAAGVSVEFRIEQSDQRFKAVDVSPF